MSILLYVILRLRLPLRSTLTDTIIPDTTLFRALPGFPNSVSSCPSSQVTQPGQPFSGFPNGIDTDVTFNKLTYRAIIAQDVAEDVNVYASYNRGFKSGGFNPVALTTPATKPEVLDASEIGCKSRTAARLLQLNASALYYIYKDITLRP